MNIEKLKDLQESFFEYYPKGFEDERFAKIVKTFGSQKFHNQVINNFKPENFSNIEQIYQDFFSILLKSPYIFFLEKHKIRNAFKSFTTFDKDMLSIFLQDILYGNFEDSFDDFVELLASKQLAKWQIATLIPYYFAPTKNFLLKPNTTKDIIKYFEIKNLKYHPKPSFEFYKNYTKILETMKKSVKSELSDDNAKFTGFLRMIQIKEYY